MYNMVSVFSFLYSLFCQRFSNLAFMSAPKNRQYIFSNFPIFISISGKRIFCCFALQEMFSLPMYAIGFFVVILIVVQTYCSKIWCQIYIFFNWIIYFFIKVYKRGFNFYKLHYLHAIFDYISTDLIWRRIVDHDIDVCSLRWSALL